MIQRLRVPLVGLLAAVVALSGRAAAQVAAVPVADAAARLAVEIDRWSAFARTTPDFDPETWKHVKAASVLALARAREALACGETWLALQRLAGAQTNLAAIRWAAERPKEARTDLAAFEGEWKLARAELRDVLVECGPDSLEGLRPLALRALGEIAWTQARTFHAASLEYAAATDASAGLFYVGQAIAARELLALCRELSVADGPSQPPLRSLAPEIDAIERELLAAYRPPRALLQHDAFIAASSLLNDARELDRAGLRAAATLRFLQGAQRSAALRSSQEPLAGEELSTRLAGLAAGIAAGKVDASIGRIFLAAAREALAATPPDRTSATVLATEVLPHWLAALEPAPPAPPPRARATLTLVRWPYT